MRVIELSKEGVKPAIPVVITSPRGRYFAFVAGEPGRGRWEYRLPLSARDYPVSGVGTIRYEGARDAWFGLPGRCDRCGAERRLQSEDTTIPCDRCMRDAAASLIEEEFALRPIGKQDDKGNDLYILIPGRDDGKQLVIWSLSPGFRGGASYSVHGQCQVIAEGREAQGAAGRMGGAPVPVVLVTGPCELRWRRTGRLYGESPSWVARYDGDEWSVGPASETELEDEIFG